MSDRSQFEDRSSTSRDFAGHRHSFLLHTPSTAGGSPVAYPTLLETNPADTIAGLIHDTRNMVMALDLYCDLLDEPGVLASPFGHYARELRLVSGASRRFMERLDRLSTLEKRSTLEIAPSGQEISAVNLLNFPDSPKEQELNGSFSMARTRPKPGAGTEIGAAFGAGPGVTAVVGAGNVGRLSTEAGPESVPSDSLLSIRGGMPLQAEPRTGLDVASGEIAKATMRSTEPVALASASLASGSLASRAVEPERSAPWPERRARSRKPLDLFVDRRIEDLAAELRANHNLLSALAGPRVTVGLSISGGQIPIMMAPEDLTRVLVNLVRNAVEAMRGVGALQISLEEGPQFLALSFADNGPGIPRDVLDKVFSPGYSSHYASHRDERVVPHPEAGADGEVELSQKAAEPSIAASNPPITANSESDLGSNATADAWPIQHRGLGLSIVRAIVTAAGGSVWASNRACNSASYLSRGTEALEEAGSGKTRAAPTAFSGKEAPSSGAIIHIEFPSSAPGSSA
jgi:hypothetical protein